MRREVILPKNIRKSSHYARLSEEELLNPNSEAKAGQILDIRRPKVGTAINLEEIREKVSTAPKKWKAVFDDLLLEIERLSNAPMVRSRSKAVEQLQLKEKENIDRMEAIETIKNSPLDRFDPFGDDPNPQPMMGRFAGE